MSQTLDGGEWPPRTAVSRMGLYEAGHGDRQHQDGEASSPPLADGPPSQAPRHFLSSGCWVVGGDASNSPTLEGTDNPK